MYYEHERCSHCGQAVPGKYSLFGFCSEDCHMRAIRPYLSSAYGIPIKDDEHFQHLKSQSDAVLYSDEVDNDLSEFVNNSSSPLRKMFGDQVEKRVNYEIKYEQDQKNMLANADAEYRGRWEAQHDYNAQQAYQKEEAKREEKLRKQREKEEEQIKTQQEKEAADAAERAAFLEMIKPRPIPNEPYRYEHTHILGPSGSGKTTLIQQIILDDLAKPDSPAYVVIDPKGLLIERIANLEVFDPDHGRLKDRLIIVDPTHDPPPALDMFRAPTNTNFTDTQRTRVLNQLIETFSYIFSSSDARLTQRQSIPFSYVVRLIFFMRGDIDTLMDVLDAKPNDPRFAPAIERLSAQDSGARRFFANDFYAPLFNETRQQIKTRLYEIIAKPELMAIFSAPECNLNLLDCLQSRKIVLVNTAMSQLGSKASQLLGRYIISMTLTAAYARFAIPKEQWNPAYLVIDEFQDFADEDKTPELLRLAREYNLGVVIAHQAMHAKELNDSLRTSISTNTSIKYSSSPEGLDMSYMARDLRCDSDFLAAQTKTATHAKFACFVRGLGLQHPFSIDVPFGNIQAQPQMSRAAYLKLIELNGKRLSARAEAPKSTATPPPTPTPETPISASVAVPIEKSPAKPSERSLKKGDSGEPSSDWKL